MSSGSLDPFLKSFHNTLQIFDEKTEQIKTFTDPEDNMKYLQALQEVQLASWAAGLAATRRHGLVKKVLDEIR